MNSLRVEESNYLLFPSVVGAVVPIVNVPGVPEDIAFTPEALAGIYLGKIRKWNDPILVRANRGLHLPDLDIVVVHRGDGSGTSYAWTDYLSKVSPEWKTEVGSSLAPQWPTGRGASGNDGVAKLVKELGGSIGYVQFIYALENHLSYGKVRNQNGEFVEASLESIAAAVEHSTRIGDDFKGSIVNAPGEGTYPIASFTWIVIPAHIDDAARRTAIMPSCGGWSAPASCKPRRSAIWRCRRRSSLKKKPPRREFADPHGWLATTMKLPCAYSCRRSALAS